MELVEYIGKFSKQILSAVAPWMDSYNKFSPKSSLGIVPPRTRLKNSGALFPDLWLEERKQTDGAEELWRIHDGLYDFTDFAKQHPGGAEWLTMTKGTDISEAFESHHISDLPQQVKEKYFVKRATTKRNFPFTFKEEGFYRTLRRAVQQTLKSVPKQSYSTSDMYSDGLLLAMLITSTLALKYWSFGLGTVAGILLGVLTTAGHNYIHKRDSFRMYYFQFSMFQVRDWRISHVLSHHLYTNTIIDLEISMVEPFLQLLPIKKYFGGYYSIILSPIVWTFVFPVNCGKRLLGAPICNYRNLKVMDLSGFVLPTFMYVATGETLHNTLIMWLFVILVGSFEFAFVGFNAAHHHPDVFHDGDMPRSIEPYDWGISQLDAVMERQDITGSDFLVLTSFGDHCLHHLFPTLDHSLLKHLYPTLEKVMKEFHLNLRLTTQWKAILGGMKQLIKVKPNPSPPDLDKYEMFSSHKVH